MFCVEVLGNVRNCTISVEIFNYCKMKSGLKLAKATA